MNPRIMRTAGFRRSGARRFSTYSGFRVGVNRTSGPKGLRLLTWFNAGLKTRSTICSTLLAYTGLPLQDT